MMARHLLGPISTHAASRSSVVVRPQEHDLIGMRLDGERTAGNRAATSSTKMSARSQRRARQ